MKFLFIFSLLFSLTANAYMDISCWNQSCLKNGWTETDMQTGQQIDVGCYRSGCEQSGWIVGDLNHKTYTQCRGAGCFIDGWYLIDSQTQSLISTIECQTNTNQPKNCLKHGWVVYSRQGQEAVVTCLNNSCETQGWTNQKANIVNHAYCKKGGCFINGWREQ